MKFIKTAIKITKRQYISMYPTSHMRTRIHAITKDEVYLYEITIDDLGCQCPNGPPFHITWPHQCKINGIYISNIITSTKVQTSCLSSHSLAVKPPIKVAVICNRGASHFD